MGHQNHVVLLYGELEQLLLDELVVQGGRQVLQSAVESHHLHALGALEVEVCPDGGTHLIYSEA